jgi:hypothetical protein
MGPQWNGPDRCNRRFFAVVPTPVQLVGHCLFGHLACRDLPAFATVLHAAATADRNSGRFAQKILDAAQTAGIIGFDRHYPSPEGNAGIHIASELLYALVCQGKGAATWIDKQIAFRGQSIQERCVLGGHKRELLS